MFTHKNLFWLLSLLLLILPDAVEAVAPPAPARTASLMAQGAVLAPAKPIKMPLEVMGPDGITQTVSVPLPAGAAPAALWMQVHGLTYENKASVRVGTGAWVSLSNANVLVAEPGKSYGGIGGAFGTLKITVPLPSGTVPGSSVSISFRFNGTDGTSIGFRVLKFNLMTAGGTPLLPDSLFYQDDPAKWTLPLPGAANIAAGKTLWESAPLVQSGRPGAPPILATCADCHAHDGADLKYFNYSNYSIIQRARFHGLSHTQAKQVACYIRSLAVINPGRPWNPPFQPGPGLDSKPADEWSAGAGLSAVLDKDADTLPFLFPHGINKAAVAVSGTLNMRELPVALQLLDWNRWLPTIHPKDAWGTEFTSSVLFARYNLLRTQLTSSGSAAYISNLYGLANDMGQWDVDFWRFRLPHTETPGMTWTPENARAVYSTQQWHLVKAWEIMQEFHLNDKAAAVIGAGAEPRSYFGQAAFIASPAMQHIPEADGLLTANALQYEYLANAWYYTGIILNAGNRHRGGTNPVDWGYVPGRFKDLSNQSHMGETMRLAAVLVKSMQQSDGATLTDPDMNWAPHWAGRVDFLVDQPDFGTTLNETLGATPAADAQNRGQMLTAIVGAWLDKNKQFTPQQYYASGQTQIDQPVSYNNMVTDIYIWLPSLRAAGVDGTLVNSVADWGKTMWPAPNWNALKQ